MRLITSTWLLALMLSLFPTFCFSWPPSEENLQAWCSIKEEDFGEYEEVQELIKEFMALTQDEVVTWLSTPVDTLGRTPLHICSSSGNLALLKIWLKKVSSEQLQVLLNVRDARGNTLLHKATSHLSVVKYFVTHKIDVNVVNDSNQTPLFDAAMNNYLVVEYLIEHGADVNIASQPTGSTPLYWAAMFGHLDIVRLLIENGANVNVDGSSDIPLIAAINGGHLLVVDHLINNGADVNNPSGLFDIPPLYYAVQKGFFDIVKILIEHGANVNSSDSHGVTPLHQAAACGFLNIVKYLIQYGANVNVGDNNGNTVLHWVASDGSLSMDIIEHIVNHGADIHSTNNYGTTPLDKAISQGNMPVIEYLTLIKQSLELGQQSSDINNNVSAEAGRTAIGYNPAARTSLGGVRFIDDFKHH